MYLLVVGKQIQEEEYDFLLLLVHIRVIAHSGKIRLHPYLLASATFVSVRSK